MSMDSSQKGYLHDVPWTVSSLINIACMDRHLLYHHSWLLTAVNFSYSGGVHPGSDGHNVMFQEVLVQKNNGNSIVLVVQEVTGRLSVIPGSDGPGFVGPGTDGSISVDPGRVGILCFDTNFVMAKNM